MKNDHEHLLTYPSDAELMHRRPIRNDLQFEATYTKKCVSTYSRIETAQELKQQAHAKVKVHLIRVNT